MVMVGEGGKMAKSVLLLCPKSERKCLVSLVHVSLWTQILLSQVWISPANSEAK